MKNIDPDVITEIKELLIHALDAKSWISVEEALDKFESEFVSDEEDEEDDIDAKVRLEE